MCHADDVLEIADRLLARLDAGATLVVATVVAIDGSAPRTIGTSMAWDGREVIGSIAGGCVEGAVVEVAERVLDDGRARTVEFGVSDETAMSVGLSCGGALRIHLELLRPMDAATGILRDAAAGVATGLVTVLRGDRPADDPRLAAELASRVAIGEPGLIVVDCEGAQVEAFVDVAVPPARFVIVGAMEYSAALAAAATAIGYAVTVCDPRELFTTSTRFPGASLSIEWPPEYLTRTGLDERSVVALLSHDDRFDADALLVALRGPAFYVGAMGSRLTHARRVEALRSLGATEHELARLHSPIGLDLGASTPAETAVSILAEVLAARSSSGRAPLRDRSGAIHQRALAH